MILRNLLPAIIWAIVILFIIAIPGSSIPESSLFNIRHFDKILHGTIFCVLAVLLLWGLFKKKKSVPYIITTIFCVIYSTVTEILQHFFVDGRSGEILDFAANIIGSLIGIAGFYYMKK